MERERERERERPGTFLELFRASSSSPSDHALFVDEYSPTNQFKATKAKIIKTKTTSTTTTTTKSSFEKLKSEKRKSERCWILYSLKRICDELSYDPASGSGESIDQSVRHFFLGKMFCLGRYFSREKKMYFKALREKNRSNKQQSVREKVWGTISDLAVAKYLTHAEVVGHQSTKSHGMGCLLYRRRKQMISDLTILAFVDLRFKRMKNYY